MYIETETTPNPATLKFLPGQPVMASGTREFINEDEAVAHVLKRHFGTFYQAERTPTEPPKGKYTFVAEVSDDVVVMYAGQIVEKGPVNIIFKKQMHPYTIGLIASMPLMSSVPKSVLPSIAGSVPAPMDYPATCRFAPRCKYADDHCRNNTPILEKMSDGHYVRCFKAGDIK